MEDLKGIPEGLEKCLKRVRRECLAGPFCCLAGKNSKRVRREFEMKSKRIPKRLAGYQREFEGDLYKIRSELEGILGQFERELEGNLIWDSKWIWKGNSLEIRVGM